jgi:L-ascorbate metabolism protein UlaG (beta-lactamase superfamily)
MPIGTYDPRKSQHCTPEQALAMASDMGASYIAPIHHDTFFRFSGERRDEPMRRLQQATQNTDVHIICDKP